MTEKDLTFHNITPKIESRRLFLARGGRLLKGALTVGATAGFLGALEYGARRHDAGLTSVLETKETYEQKKALELFRALGEENFVHNLVSAGEKDGERVIPVNLRNKPLLPHDKDDFDAGKVIGKLDPGIFIDKALVVLGSNRRATMDRKSEDIWYAFLNPSNSEEIVFAYTELFDPDSELPNVKPIRLQG